MELSVSYQNDPEDVIALLRYQLANNAPFRRRRSIAIGLLLVLQALCLAGVFFFPEGKAWLIAGTIGFAILLFASHLAYTQLPNRIFKSKYANSKECEKKYRITVKKSGLLVQSGSMTNKHNWSDYSHYAMYKDYMLIFNKQGAVHVVPKRDISEEQFLDFFNAVTKHLSDQPMADKKDYKKSEDQVSEQAA